MLLVWLAIVAGNACAEEPTPTPLRPWSALGDHAGALFSGDQWPWQLSAVLSTMALVGSGTDDALQEHFQEKNPLGAEYADAMYLAGYVLPLAVGGTLHAFGSNPRHRSAGAAALQAAGLAVGLAAGAKFISGRRGPRKTDCALFCTADRQRAEHANAFNFALWKRELPAELFWPSAHAAAATAVVASLTTYYPQEEWIPWVGYGVVGLMSLGLLEGDFHWGSDLCAGALLGQAVGRTVGLGFRENWGEARGTAEKTQRDVALLPRGDALGFRIVATF